MTTVEAARRAVAALTLAAWALRLDRREQRRQLGERCDRAAADLKEAIGPAALAKADG